MNSNIDTDEVEKFNQLARKWWDKNSEFKPLHAINPLRLDYITERMTLEGARALDVGCGGGILSESLALAGATVTAIDMAEMPLQIARLHAAETGVTIDYRDTTIESLAGEMQETPFDMISCMEMLEHVPDPDSVIESCARLLKPGGHLFLSTINRNPKAWLLAIVGAEYLLRMLPKGTHDYAKLIRPSELSASLRQHGFRVVDITGMTYNPLADRYKLSRDTDVNYLAHAVYEG